MHTVYIIYSASLDKYFVGQTKDMQVSLWLHNGKANTDTAEGKPWVVKFTQAFDTRNEAQSLEMKLKHKKQEELAELVTASV